MSASQNSTCIVGIADEKGVYLMGDSAGTNGRFQQAIRNDVKVFRVGEIIMGGTTSFRMIQLLHHKLRVPKQLHDQTDMDFMVCDFVDSVRKCFHEGGFGDDKGPKGESGGSFLVGYRGNLYGVYDDFQVALHKDNYNSVGCGEDLALGSLYTTKDLKMSPKDRLTKALDAACHHSAGCAGHYTYEELLNPTSAKKKTKTKK